MSSSDPTDLGNRFKSGRSLASNDTADGDSSDSGETVAVSRPAYDETVAAPSMQSLGPSARFTGNSVGSTAFQQTEAGAQTGFADIHLPDRFEMRESLGAGGMGEVVLAHDNVLDRDVAIKVLKTGDFGDRAMTDRLLNEAQAAAQIRHPHIVSIHDVNLERGLIVMEYLPGGSGRTLLEATGKIPIKDLIPLARNLCSALAAAHGAGLVHRDIKPDNVLFDAHGNVKVADFGVAQFRRKTTSGGSEIVGTPAYMAPEQLRGADPDPRADIYALGLTLYELASGRRFHNPEGPSDHTIKGLTRAVGNRQLAKILHQCLHEDPGHRWQNAKELERAFLRLLKRRQRLRLSGAIVVVALITTGALALGLSRGRTGPPALLKVAAVPFENRTSEPRLDWLRRGLASLLSASLHRRTVPVLRHAQLRDRAGDSALTSDWERAAQSAGASDILSGSFSRSGKVLSVTAKLRGKVYRASGSSSRVDAIADEIAAAIVKDVIGDKQKPKTTGRSPAAVRSYELGYAALQQHEFQRAVELLKEAIRLDPDYVDARYALITAQSSIGAATATLVAAANDALSRPLRPRERALFEALRLRVLRRYDEASKRYDKLVSQYPTEKEAHYGLADSLFHLGRGNRAMLAFKKLVKLAPGFHLAYHHPLEWLGTRGRSKEIGSYLYHLRRANPPKPFLALMEVRMEVARRNYPRALESIKGIKRPTPELLAAVAGVEAIIGDLDTARDLFAQASALSPDNWKLRIARAALDLTEGRIEEFQNDAAWVTESVSGVTAAANRLASRGLMYALLGRLEEAQRDLTEVRSRVGPQIQRRIPRLVLLESLIGWASSATGYLKDLHKRLTTQQEDRAGRMPETIPFLSGAIFASSGKPKQALQKFREGYKLREGPSYSPIFLLAIARASLAEGKPEEAATACESILRPSAFSSFRAPAVPPCMGILALVRDVQGKKKEALDYANRLLKIWRAPKSDIPEIGYARQVVEYNR